MKSFSSHLKFLCLLLAALVMSGCSSGEKCGTDFTSYYEEDAPSTDSLLDLDAKTELLRVYSVRKELLLKRNSDATCHNRIESDRELWLNRTSKELSNNLSRINSALSSAKPMDLAAFNQIDSERPKRTSFLDDASFDEAVSNYFFDAGQITWVETINVKLIDRMWEGVSGDRGRFTVPVNDHIYESLYSYTPSDILNGIIYENHRYKKKAVRFWTKSDASRPRIRLPMMDRLSSRKLIGSDVTVNVYYRLRLPQGAVPEFHETRQTEPSAVQMAYTTTDTDLLFGEVLAVKYEDELVYVSLK